MALDWTNDEITDLFKNPGVPITGSYIAPAIQSSLFTGFPYVDEFLLAELNFDSSWQLELSLDQLFSTADSAPSAIDEVIDSFELSGVPINEDQKLKVTITAGWQAYGSFVKWIRVFSIYYSFASVNSSYKMQYETQLSTAGAFDTALFTYPYDPHSDILLIATNRDAANLEAQASLQALIDQREATLYLVWGLPSSNYYKCQLLAKCKSSTINGNGVIIQSDTEYGVFPNHRILGSSYISCYFWDAFNNPASTIPYNLSDVINFLYADLTGSDSDGNSQNGNGSSGGGSWGGGYPGIYRKDQSNMSGWGTIPDLSAVGTGFVSLYSPTLAELKSLGEFLWSKDFFDNILKNYQSPLENIISLSIIPHFPVGSLNATLSIGNVATEITAPKLTGQFIKYSLGSVSVDEFYRTFADYEPLEKLTLFLPFVGFTPLSTDDFMNGSLTVEYMIDLLSGSFVAGVIASGKGTKKLLYQYSGSLGYQIPLSGANFLSYFSQIATGAFSVAKGAGQLISGNPASGVSDVINGGAQAIFAKPDYQRSGSISNGSSLLSQHCASIIFSTPQNTTAGGLGSVGGFVSNKWQSVGAYSGFTQFSSIKLEGITGATQDEMNEIARQLKEGVII